MKYARPRIGMLVIGQFFIGVSELEVSGHRIVIILFDRNASTVSAHMYLAQILVMKRFAAVSALEVCVTDVKFPVVAFQRSSVVKLARTECASEVRLDSCLVRIAA